MFSRLLRPAALLFLVAFLAHAPALRGVLPGALPSTGDTLGAFAPWHEFARGELAKNGAIPLWNPHLYGGVPFAANGQSALFYPPTYLHFLLPERFALWTFALFHSYFYMLGGYFLGRTLGFSRRAAFLCGLLLGLGNATPAHLFGGHLTFLPTRTFWPYQAAFLIRILRGDAAKFDAKNAIALAACLALGLAAGAPQLWLFGILFCAAIALFWLGDALRKRLFPALWPWKTLAFSLFLGAMWCAPVLLPLRELKGWSSHGERLSFSEVTDLSATPFSLLRLSLNQFFGGNSQWMWSLPANPGEDGAGIGLAPLLLAIIAPFLARTSTVCRAIWAGCSLSLLLALGSATPLYRALYDHIALFQITRVPARWLELWAFGAAILTGFSFDALMTRASSATFQKRSWGRARWLWSGAALSIAVLAAAANFNRDFWRERAQNLASARQFPVSQWPEIAIRLQNNALFACFLAFCALIFLAMVWPRHLNSRRAIALSLVALAAEPLANFWLNTFIASPAAVQRAQLPASLARHFRAGERWIVRAPFQQLNATLAPGIDALNGYEPFGSAPFFNFAAQAQIGARFSADFQPETMNPLWRVMGASHVLWKPKFEGDAPRGFAGNLVARAEDWRLNSIQDGLKPWPRAYLTRDFHRVSASQTWPKLQQLAAQGWQGAPPATVSPDFSPFYRAPLESVAPPGAAFTPLRAGLQTPDVRVWHTATTRPALFVQNEVMAPGWKAFVDEKPVKIHLANAIFRGVSVPANTKKVALVYSSQTLRFGLFLALCGLSLAAFCWISRRFGA